MKKFSFYVLAATALCITAINASAQTVVIVSPNSAVISKDQLANIYLGRSNELNPFDLTEGSPLRDGFYKSATSRGPAQIKATWARIMFTGRGSPPREVSDAAAMKKAVASDPKAIGYIDKAALDSSVKAVLTLD